MHIEHLIDQKSLLCHSFPPPPLPMPSPASRPPLPPQGGWQVPRRVSISACDVCGKYPVLVCLYLSISYDKLGVCFGLLPSCFPRIVSHSVFFVYFFLDICFSYQRNNQGIVSFSAWRVRGSWKLRDVWGSKALNLPSWGKVTALSTLLY